MKKLIAVFAMLLVMGGCSSEKTKSMTCNISSENGEITMKNIYTYTEEELKLIKVESDTVVKFNDTDLKKESQESLAESTKEKYEQYEGLDYSYKVTDTEITQHATADLKVLPADALTTLGLSIDPETFEPESFKSNMETLGYTCE